eukprot:4578981-Pyramimonas_sp.AAC.1
MLKQIFSRCWLSCATFEAILGHAGFTWCHHRPTRALRHLAPGPLQARGGAPLGLLLGPSWCHQEARQARQKRIGEKANVHHMLE